jgi:hypothetical protein
MRHIDLAGTIIVDWSEWRDLWLDCWRQRDDGDDWNFTVVVGHVVNNVSVELKQT